MFVCADGSCGCCCQLTFFAAHFGRSCKMLFKAPQKPLALMIAAGHATRVEEHPNSWKGTREPNPEPSSTSAMLNVFGLLVAFSRNKWQHLKVHFACSSPLAGAHPRPHSQPHLRAQVHSGQQSQHSSGSYILGLNGPPEEGSERVHLGALSSKLGDRSWELRCGAGSIDADSEWKALAERLQLRPGPEWQIHWTVEPKWVGNLKKLLQV